MGYRFVDAVPTVEEHGALAIAVGWHDDFHWESVPASLAGSVCGVVAYDPDGQGLYASEGFVAENTVGMWQVLRPGRG
jgi:hypothetical protein